MQKKTIKKSQILNLKSCNSRLRVASYELRASRGFTMLFALVVSSLLILIGISIINIMMKESIISSSSRDTQKAFYAANAGLDCFYYHDLNLSNFEPNASGVIARTITCNSTLGSVNFSESRGIDDPWSPITTDNDNYFYLTDDMNGPCFSINLKKEWTFIPGDLGPPVVPEQYNVDKTYLQVRGYNICNTANISRVERGIEITY